MRVLVADDDIMIRYTTKVALRELGHEASEAVDGESVLRCLETEPPDVVVLDLCMPIMTGYEVLRWLRARPSLHGVPVIILSAFVSDPDELKRHPNVVAVLDKPLYVDDLHLALQHCEERMLCA